MALLDTILDAVSLAFCEKGRRAMLDEIPVGDVLLDVARQSYDYMRKHGGGDDIRRGLEAVAKCEHQEFQTALGSMMDRLARVQLVSFRGVLWNYLTAFPVTVRQHFRRPSDPTGRTAPEKLDFYRSEQLLPYLPPRRPRFRSGSKLPKLDNWRLTELVGFGLNSEVWFGIDDSQAAVSPAALKFANDPASTTLINAEDKLLMKVFNLNEESGVVPLRSVYVATERPCLEYAFVYGYDLTGLIHEWHARYETSKPEAALKLIRRLAEVVGKAHMHGIVHRGLKPSNVLVHPDDGGKFSLWISDWGWGQIEDQRAREAAKIASIPKATQLQLAERGSLASLYCSPQQERGERPDSRDDVYALGVIWYQLLKRDPKVAAPVGEDWADEFYPHGLTQSQAKLLSACVSTRAERRPGDARSLSELLRAETANLGPANSKISLPAFKTERPSSVATPITVTKTPETPGKPEDPNAAAADAAATLSRLSGASLARSAQDSLTGSGSHPAIGPDRGLDGRPKKIRNSLGMTFTYIPPGAFEMGAREEEPGHKPHETPRHPIRIQQGFYISTTPVTQSQYERLIGKNPSYFTKWDDQSDLPVEMVTWFEAERFCQKLMMLSDEALSGRLYRLPTEAEWEYACRAGTTTAYWFGSEAGPKQVHAKGSSFPAGETSVVGRTLPNPWGLHDVHGNVSEWCQDWYEEYYYFDTPGIDPTGPMKGEKKTIRGGSWTDPITECRSASRAAMEPTLPCNNIGFRVVLSFK